MTDVGFISIIGKINDPIFFKVYGVGNPLEMQFAAFTSLDFFDSKRLKESNEVNNNHIYFLGRIDSVLIFNHDYELYAYILPNGIKILVAFAETHVFDLILIKKFFEYLHRIVSDTLCNPFLKDNFELSNFSKKINILIKSLQQRIL